MNRIKYGTERRTERETERGTERRTEQETERATERKTELGTEGKAGGKTLSFFNVHCDPHPIYFHLPLYKYPRPIISNVTNFLVTNS